MTNFQKFHAVYVKYNLKLGWIMFELEFVRMLDICS